MSEVQSDYKPISIVLDIDGKEKRFVTPKRVKGSLWREAAMVAEEIEQHELVVPDLDSHMDFVCRVFDNQFTLSEFEDGVDARDLIKIIYATSIFVMGQVTLAAEMLTKNVDIAEINEKKT